MPGPARSSAPTASSSVAAGASFASRAGASHSGRIWGERNFYRDVWVPAQLVTGLDPTPHEFRHSYVTHLRAAGIDDADLALVAGHTGETMISVYTHPLQRSHDAIRAVIGQMSQPAAGTILGMTTKERLHKLVDDLSEQEAAAALVIVERRRDDPMIQALASAPLDDEASDAEENASAAEAFAAHDRGESVSSEDLRAELDLD